MTQINKTAIVSQLESFLSGLTVSSKKTEDLLVYLKTALNAEVSASNVINELTNRIESASNSESIFELVHLVKSLELITQNRKVSVPNLSDLENLTNLDTGSIVFVESEGVPYILMSNSEWETLFLTILPANENAYAWGLNTSGRLGDGTTTSRLSPVSVVGGFTDWIDASAGSFHSLGIRANGTLWAWGNNGQGRLGDGTITDQSSPVSVVGGFTDWIDASAGSFHSLGIRANGTLWAWGNNGQGRLGDGTITDQSSPVSVVGGFADWIDVSAGSFHSLGIRSNGTLWAWGNNTNGRLGDGTTTDRSSPVSVVGGFTDWIDASAGNSHSLGIRADGTAWAWGFNAGRLGDGTITGRSSPVSVVGGFTDWISVSAGTNHSLGLRANGTAWAWGYNGQGRLGDGTITSRLSPVSVLGGFTDWIDVSAGSDHSLGVRANGTAWAWGFNGNGRLGDGTTTNKSSPVSVVGGFTDWIGASAGGSHSLGIRGV